MTQQVLNCGQTEHTCVTEGCAADCALPEHTHTAQCDMENVYYKWSVVKDTSGTFDAAKGLPIRFFIAAPGEAAKPSGTYTNYKSNLWGTTGGTTGAYAKAGTENIVNDYGKIMSETGIRNISDESGITEHIFKYPDDYNADSFKDFGSISFNGRTYSQDDYEIKWVTICYRNNSTNNPNYSYQRCACYGYNDPHIHIDGVLTRRIKPAAMELTKKLVNADGTEYTAQFQENFTFTLEKLAHNDNGPIDTLDTAFGTNGSIQMSASISRGSSTADILSDSDTEITFGYYRLTENNSANARWQNAGTDLIYNDRTTRYPAGPVYIQIATDGSLRFSNTLNGTYSQADDIVIKNTRKPYQVTYTWAGIPEGLTILPEGRNDVLPGEEVNINTSYPKGARVLGQGENEGKYYVFEGWQYYDAEGESRQYIDYGSSTLPQSPKTVTVNSNVTIHGKWVEYNLSTVAGHITISKTFVGKPQGANLDNFYIAVLHGGEETDITPAYVGTWNADKTSWTYNFPISDSGDYTIVEGKYDVAGYNVTANSAVTEVTGISSDVRDYKSSNIFITDGHSYYEVGKTVTINLPFDTSAVDGAAAQSSSEGIHAANVSFVNSYEKRTAATEDRYPDLHIRKWDAEYSHLLPGATFTLTKQGDASFSHELTTDAAGEITIAEHTAHEIDLEAGTYYLTETAAPNGYIRNGHTYTITVTKADLVEELRLACNNHLEGQPLHANACYSYFPVQNYAMTVTDGAGNEYTSESFSGRFNPSIPRLNIPNNQIKADLTLKKEFVLGNQTFTPTGAAAGASILVDIYGPVVYEGTTVKDIGSLLYNDLVISADNDWSTKISNLPYGDYFVEEVMGSIHGYTLQAVTFNSQNPETVGGHTGVVVKVADSAPLNVTIRNQYEKWTAAEFYVMKTDAQMNDIAGVTFKLLDADDNDVTALHLPDGVTEAVTDANGNIHFTNFDTTANYKLVEVSSAPGYYKGTNVYNITVTAQEGEYDLSIASGAWDDTDDTLTVLNTPILGQIEVSKEFAGDKVPDDTLIIYQLTNADGSVFKVASVAQKDDWKHTFTDLPMGIYTVTESCSIDGYTYTTTYKVNNGDPQQGTVASVTLVDDSNGTLTEGLPSGAKAKVVFTNTYDRQEKLIVNAAAFSVLKVDENGEALPGATFTLYDENGGDLDASKVPFATSHTTDAAGVARFTGLKLEDLLYSEYISSTARSAVFLLRETNAPDGYVKQNTAWQITLTENKIKIDEINDRGIFETIVDWIAGLGSGSSGDWISNSGSIPMLKVTNQRIKGDLTVTKDYGAADGDKEHTSVEIHVHGPITRGENNAITDIGPLVNVIKLSNGATTGSLQGLELGEYVLRETFASISGYTWDGVTYTVDKSEKTTETYQGKDFVSFTVDSASPDVSVALTNSYTEWDKPDFTIYKYSHYVGGEEGDKLSTGLPGATFTLYVDKACTDVAQTVTTGIAGYATFHDLEIPANVDQKTYYLKETVPPTNYKPTDKVWQVTLTHGNDGFNIAITDGTESANTSGSGWVWNGGMNVLSVANEEILGKIQVTKEFVGELIPKGLNQINVSLYDASGNLKGSTALKADTDAAKNWKDTFDNLPMGTYYLAEDGAEVPGYTLTSKYSVNNEEAANAYAEITLAPGDGDTVPEAVVKISNTYVKQSDLFILPTSLTVEKRDSETEKLLPGARFVLKDANGQNVANTETQDYWETDENGRFTISELKLTAEQNAALLRSASVNQPVTYTLQEAVAPAGYKPSDKVWTISLTGENDQVDIVDPVTNKFTTIIKTILGMTSAPATNDTMSEDTPGEDGILTVYNAPIKGSLNITKTYTFQDSSGQQQQTAPAMTGISSEIHAHGPFQSANVTVEQFAAANEYKLSLSDGATEGTISDLPLGYYLVHEPFSSVHGYNWTVGGSFSGHSQTVTLTHDGVNYTYYVYQLTANQQTNTANDIAVTITNSYTKWTAADFWVHKVDEHNNNLPGATFRLLDGTNDVTANYLDNTVNGSSAVSNDSGLIHFHNFTLSDSETSKTFTLEEISAPAGYKIGTKNTWTIVVSHDGTGYELKIDGDIDDADTIIVTNATMKGKLTIVKEFDGDKIYGATATSDPVALSIPVQITCPDGTVRDVTLSGNSNAEQLTETIEDLPLGTYTVTEPSQSAKIAGYDLLETTYQVGNAATNAVTLTNEEPVTVTITNTYDRNEAVINNPDQFTILKTDENGNPLAGAEFTLTNNRNTTEIHSYVTGADGKVIVDGLIGNGTITSQSDRTYTLEETKAPVGHELGANNTWTILVSEEDGQPVVNLTADHRTYETVWDWLIETFDPDSVFSNGTLTVENTRKTAKVTVEKTVEYSGLADPETDEFVQNKLKNAEYSFELYIDGKKEDTLKLIAGTTGTFDKPVPYGSSYEVREVKSGDSLFTVTLSNASDTVGQQDLDGIVVEAKNTYKFQMAGALKLEMTKVSSGTARIPLEGAQFALYDGNSKLLSNYRSGKDGKFLISEITAPGTYTLKETVAPSGYHALKKPITIEAEYVHVVAEDNGKPVIVKMLVASVDGRGVYEISANSYGIKNTMITGNPITGDSFPLGTWLGIGGGSVAALLLLFLTKKKKPGKYCR